MSLLQILIAALVFSIVFSIGRLIHAAVTSTHCDEISRNAADRRFRDLVSRP